MGKVVGLRLSEEQAQRLKRVAREMGQPASRAAAILLEEALRRRDFPLIEHRDSPAGQQAYIQGTRLTVWMVKRIADDFGGSAMETADYLDVPVAWITEALRYAEVCHEEIDAAIADNDRIAADPKRYIPNIQIVRVDASAS